jgi:polysaccharide export outer membrane protein
MAFASTAAGLLILLTGSGAQGQTNPAISASLDNTSSITSRGARPQLNTAGPVMLPDDYTKIRLEPGHVLQMSIFDAPEMTENMTVDEEGNISVPLAGIVHVAGDSLREAEQSIANALVDKDMLKAPQVTVSIAAFVPRSVVVAGEVQQPGRVQLLAPRPLLDVLAAVGGVTTAAGGQIEIRRRKPDGQEDIQTIPYANNREPVEAQAALVQPGDTIFVRRAGVIYVLGAVTRPGGFLMVNGGLMNLTQAIAFASGTTAVAATSKTIIVRRSGSDLIQLKPQLDKVQRGLLAAVPLQDGDMVYVPTSKIKSALIDSSAVLSAAASAGIYVGVNH